MESNDGERVVTVLPITHTKPADKNLALELPATVRKRLGLDGERSWQMQPGPQSFGATND